VDGNLQVARLLRRRRFLGGGRRRVGSCADGGNQPVRLVDADFSLREQGIDLDLSKLDPAAIETMLKDLGEMNIDIDSGKAQVRITCE